MKQRDFIALFYPELSFLGDYHSHPYTTPIDGIKTELDLERKECYRFSSADFNSVNYQQEIERDYRVGLVCSGSMIPDTNVGGNIATINEVSDDQKATFFFS